MHFFCVFVMMLSLCMCSCQCSDGGSHVGPDGSTDADGDGDTDTDTDADSDTDTDTDADAGPDASEDSGPPLAVVWIPIAGGTYLMGSAGGPNTEEQPAHEVSIPAFEMTKTETTIFQYEDCVEEGACTAPDTSEGCNWGVAGRGNHPANCIDVFQAEVYCAWLGGRLPSESEWEYAARSGGQDIEYPWGDETPSCGLAVMAALIGDEVVDSCGEGARTWPVCSRPLGNTAQGLCDMAGNVWEWVPDRWHVNYYTAPTDGSVWEWPDDDSRILRGGAYNAPDFGIRARLRGYWPESYGSARNGFRCARAWTGSPDGGVIDAGADGGV